MIMTAIQSFTYKERVTIDEIFWFIQNNYRDKELSRDLIKQSLQTMKKAMAKVPDELELIESPSKRPHGSTMSPDEGKRAKKVDSPGSNLQQKCAEPKTIAVTGSEECNVTVTRNQEPDSNQSSSLDTIAETGPSRAECNVAIEHNQEPDSNPTTSLLDTIAATGAGRWEKRNVTIAHHQVPVSNPSAPLDRIAETGLRAESNVAIEHNQEQVSNPSSSLLNTIAATGVVRSEKRNVTIAHHEVPVSNPSTGPVDRISTRRRPEEHNFTIAHNEEPVSNRSAFLDTRRRPNNNIGPVPIPYFSLNPRPNQNMMGLPSFSSLPYQPGVIRHSFPSGFPPHREYYELAMMRQMGLGREVMYRELAARGMPVFFCPHGCIDFRNCPH